MGDSIIGQVEALCPRVPQQRRECSRRNCELFLFSPLKPFSGRDSENEVTAAREKRELTVEVRAKAVMSLACGLKRMRARYRAGNSMRKRDRVVLNYIISTPCECARGKAVVSGQDNRQRAIAVTSKHSFCQITLSITYKI